MKKLSDREIKRAALIAGLRLFGLPNHKLRRSDYDIETDAENLNIDLEEFVEPGGYNSGLIWCKDAEIVRDKVSERVDEELHAALENAFCIGDFEYIFYPNSPKKELKDYSSLRKILNPEIRDSDGKVYTVCGESCNIQVIEIDISLGEGIRMVEEIGRETGYSEEEIRLIKAEIVADNP